MSPAHKLMAPRPLPIPASSRPWVFRVILFATCALAMNALLGERGLLEKWRAEQQADRIEGELTALRLENADLRSRVRHLTDDAKTIEAIARTELGLVRPGELLVVLKDRPAR